MVLCYRGVKYAYPTHAYQTRPGEVIGKYRGKAVCSFYVTSPIYQPIHLLTYRGVTYFTSGRRAPELPAPNTAPAIQTL